MSAEVAAVLERAADLIEERGWTQGAWQDNEGCLCLYGAVLTACGGGEVDGEPWRAVKAVTSSSPIFWNDRPGRTKAEVVAALRAAASDTKGTEA